MKETLNNNLAELTKAVDKAILDIDEMETTIEEESERLDARLEGDGAADIYDAIYQDGVEAGKKSEYDAFWDAYQEYGYRTFYYAAFSGSGWTNDTYKPKYDIIPQYQSGANSMFANSYNITDIYTALDEKGLKLDFSKNPDFSYTFNGARSICYLRTIDASLSQNMIYTFADMRSCTTIEKLILTDNITYIGTFYVCDALKNITIEGIIGQNGFDVSWSPLNKDSIISVINALSSTTTGLTVTLRLDAVNTAFETTPGAADGSTSDEWLALAATKSNWTISLINS